MWTTSEEVRTRELARQAAGTEGYGADAPFVDRHAEGGFPGLSGTATLSDLKEIGVREDPTPSNAQQETNKVSAPTLKDLETAGLVKVVPEAKFMNLSATRGPARQYSARRDQIQRAHV